MLWFMEVDILSWSVSDSLGPRDLRKGSLKSLDDFKNQATLQTTQRNKASSAAAACTKQDLS